LKREWSAEVSNLGRGELCADERMRIVVHHEWGLEREVTNFSIVVHLRALGRRLYSQDEYTGDGITARRTITCWS